MTKKSTALCLSALALILPAMTHGEETTPKKKFADRLSVEGYIELAAQWSSDRLGDHRSNPLPEYPGWNVNLPNACIWATLDIGKGWSLGTQVSFSNSGTVPIKGVGNAASRPIGWDQALTLEELWVQKSFSNAANLRIGLIGTPVGRQNDFPTQFFGVIRPEDGPGFLALNNQSPSVSFSGESGVWSYSVLAIPGFVNYDYGNDNWRLGLGDESYTQTIDRLYGGAFRVDNNSVEGLTVGLSGEVGGGRTRIEDECGDGNEGEASRRLNSILALAAVDWEYDDHNMIFRGAYQYGYVGNSNPTTYEDVLYGKPSDMMGMSLGAEFGYDFFSLSKKLEGKQKFYVFARYDWNRHRDCREMTGSDNRRRDGQRVSVGINWFATPQIIVKGEFGMGYDADPARVFAGLGIAWQPTYP